MIYYLLTERGDHTFRDSPILDDPRLAGRFEVVTYTEAFRRRHWQGGTIVFSDIDRLMPADMLRATLLYRRLRRARGRIRLLNHPTRTASRYTLLRRLYEAGINRHNVYRVDEERRHQRFPVFLRSDSRHDGPYTDLIRDGDTLDAEIWRLTSFGLDPRDLLIVEYFDTADDMGVYRKCTAFVVGDAIFQRYMCFGDRWVVSPPRTGDVRRIRDEQSMIDEEAGYVGADTWLPVLRRVAELGGLGFGRIDFGVKDGRPEIWEANTNPDPAASRYAELGGREERIVPIGRRLLRDALVALDDDAAHATAIEIDTPPATSDWYDWFKDDVRQRIGKSA
ncbi:MAG: hypothetical protein WD044_02640 [Dongiaceae bacterium]